MTDTVTYLRARVPHLDRAAGWAAERGRRTLRDHRGLATTELVIWALVLASLAIAVGWLLYNAVSGQAEKINDISIPTFNTT